MRVGGEDRWGDGVERSEVLQMSDELHSLGHTYNNTDKQAAPALASTKPTATQPPLSTYICTTHPKPSVLHLPTSQLMTGPKPIHDIVPNANKLMSSLYPIHLFL